ncbi:MAG TPA: putative sulfate exporter family transporter [Steroidobacteraceae bacterium]|nr:putative sulfate exporter family transporter [Steroidobacteraceae bacterium]
MKNIPGLVLAVILALLGNYFADQLSAALGLGHGAVSGIMVAILLGLAVGNLFRLPAALKPGISFAVKRVLRIGIVLLGLRLSIVEVGSIGLKALPVILVTIPAAILIVTYLGRRIGLADRLGSLIAVGTSICGNTAIVAVSPTIGAKEEETSYAVACITVFGLFAMLVYPFVAHWIFSADPFQVGVFLGSAVHDTSQVAGAGMVYQEYYHAPEALNVATVTKLERNLSMLIVIPLMSILYHRRSSEGAEPPPWWSMVPLFVLGFAAMSLLRTVGDLGDRPFGFLEPGQWQTFIKAGKEAAGYCLAIAMAGVGLGTSIKGLRSIGLKPLMLGLASALIVGIISVTLVTLFY